MSSSAASRDACFRLIEQAAIAGERCPVNKGEAGGPPEMSSAIVADLAREGRIRVEISSRNWRTITLLSGDHAGKQTKPDPRGGFVWKTIPAVGVTAPKGPMMREPSKPRSFG